MSELITSVPRHSRLRRNDELSENQVLTMNVPAMPPVLSRFAKVFAVFLWLSLPFQEVSLTW
jgi:hypothetical protein